MAKEYRWNVTVDGVAHTVQCQPAGNRYLIWVDDEELTVVYRRSYKKMRYGLEERLEICGKQCLFIVWDERADLVVDGILSSGKDYQQEKSRRIKRFVSFAWSLFAAGAVLLVAVVVFFCLGWVTTANRAKYVTYAIAAVWLMVNSLLQQKRWKTLS